MHIELLMFKQEDIGRLLSWVDSKELLLSWAGSFFEFPLSQMQCEQYLETSLVEPPSRLIFKAVDSDSGEVVGHIELDGIDLENQSAFISRVLVGANAQRGRGIGQAIVLQLVNAAFTQLALHRIAVGVLDFNDSAIYCYEKCGFKYEGRYRDIVKCGDQYYSVVTMSLLRSEWQSAEK
ncbi:MAG: GNAT family N-acetyltransferase [Gammaproteobacteria bacterium]|nr:MAG: GNAT family N-acetyltransferase [Gammaproteobacteria bacterium]